MQIGKIFLEVGLMHQYYKASHHIPSSNILSECRIAKIRLIFFFLRYAAHFAIDALDQQQLEVITDIKRPTNANKSENGRIRKTKWAWQHQRIASVAELNSATI